MKYVTGAVFCFVFFYSGSVCFLVSKLFNFLNSEGTLL